MRLSLMMELEACDCKCNITFLIYIFNCCTSNKTNMSGDICAHGTRAREVFGHI